MQILPLLLLACLKGKCGPQQSPKERWPQHRASHLACEEQPRRGNRPTSLELQTAYRGLHFTSVLYRTISSSLGKKKKILASHIACAKICKVKSAVMSVEIQQRNSENKNPKAEETLRSYGSSGEFTSDVPAPHTVTDSRDHLSAR